MGALKIKELKLHNFFFVLISVFLVFIGILTFILYKNAGKLKQLENTRYKLYALGMELKESSEDLTKFCRTYVTTGDSNWEQKYWELLDIRNGKKPRPDGNTIALRDTLFRLGIIPEEYEKLSLAEKNSNDLVWTESVAFHAMKGLFADSSKKFSIRARPDTLLALKIMYDPKYFAGKEKIMQPIAQFRFMLDQRISSSINVQKSKNNILFTAIVIAIIIISLLSFYAILVLRKRIILQIEELEVSNDMIKQNEEKLIQHNKELDVIVEERNQELILKYQELTRSQEKIKKSESQLQAFFDSVDGGACLLNAQKKFVIFNSRFIENHLFLTGKTPEPGEEIYSHFSPDMRSERLNLLDQVLQGHKEILETDHTRDDKRIIFRTSYSPVMTDGKVTGDLFIYMDITYMKETEAALRQSENKFKDLVEKSMVGVIIIQDGKYAYVNPRLAEIFGYTQEELLDSFSPVTLIYKEDMEIVKENIRAKSNREIDSSHYEVRALKKDGKMIWIEIYSSTTVYQGNNAIIGSLIDITEKKESEIALRQSENKFRDLVEKNLAGVYILDVTTIEYLYISPRFCELFGYGEKEMMTIFPTELVHPDDREILFQNIQRRLKGDLDSIHYTARAIRKNKEIFWVEVFVNSTMYNGRLANIGTVFEITDRKKAELELKESEEKFRSLVEQTLVGVMILQEGKLKYVNPGFEKITGYPKEKLVNEMPFDKLVHDDDVDMVRKNYLLRISGNTPADQYVFKAIRSDGEVTYIEAIVSRIIYENKPAVIGTMVDITDRVEEEKRIGKAVNEAQETERIQIGMELHDNVKQIMAASLMHLDFVKHGLDNKQQAIEIIDNIKSYIKEAITELRRLSHQLAPSVDTEDSLAEKVEKLVNAMNKDNKLKVFVNIDELKQPLNDDTQIAFYRILQEQFNNILKYAKASSVFVSIKLRHNDVHLTIKDDGKGFDSTAKKDGIGLMNIKRRATVLGGQVKIISSPGNGCEVNVQVPIDQ